MAEAVHRDLILFYTQLGKRELALRQYEECARVLEHELGPKRLRLKKPRPPAPTHRRS
jgi:DNA-binding SARP family transcriptional activator